MVSPQISFYAASPTLVHRSMNHDREVYGPDVDQFRPERFLQQTEKEGEYALRPEYVNEDGHCSYGFGRR